MTLAIDDAATVRVPSPGAAPGADTTADDAPLLLLLHGYGAHEGDLVPLLEHLGHPGDAAALRAPLPMDHGGWAWFPITTIGAPDPAAVQAAADAVLAWLAQHAGGRRVLVLGFSQGGAVALQVARTSPQAFAALVVLSGFVSPTPHPGDAALAAAAPPSFLGHGDADAVIPPAVTELTAAWMAEHTTLTRRAYTGLPHGVGGQEVADVADFLAGLAGARVEG
ncbi:alpha/beta hydrolase [Litorihabitans aurantiacus]|uniref:Phospholipase/carboxylesterase n=1 Tax=Litorihabitans aurantiacus TaxID=1930061 RepID=A0AA37XEV2_9MICO|nr:alpha/beta fold hydrolase [Litorihabitans aurantiacus]GMA31907.1 phospholipase/carboxylesterase [Litorihabitans aurantiacus]